MALYLVYILTLLASIIIGFRFWDCLKHSGLHFLTLLLLLTFLNELYCFYIVETYNASTGWNYNLVTLGEACFFSWFYSSIPILKKYRTVILGSLSVFIATAITIYLFFSTIHDFNTHLFLAAALILVLWGLLFLFEYFRLDQPDIEKKLLPSVWITAGIIMFFSVTSITFSLYESLVSYKVTILGYKLHQLIPQLMSIFRYGCFAIGFYLCRKTI